LLLKRDKLGDFRLSDEESVRTK